MVSAAQRMARATKKDRGATGEHAETIATQFSGMMKAVQACIELTGDKNTSVKIRTVVPAIAHATCSMIRVCRSILVKIHTAVCWDLIANCF